LTAALRDGTNPSPGPWTRDRREDIIYTVTDVIDLNGVPRRPGRPRLIVAAAKATDANRGLVDAGRRLGFRSLLRTARETERIALPGDVVLARMDVKPTLDGVDPGLGTLGLLAERGVQLLNPPGALLGAHDKLETARLIAGAGLPHPHTTHVTEPVVPVDAPVPAVVKPRFGSWGIDVVLCHTEEELRAHLWSLRRRPWFRRHGALLQSLVPLQRHDLRIVVAGGQVVGAIERHAAPGEWRTNIALGGHRLPARPDCPACELALAAASAISGDLVGVDLLPDGNGGYVIIELNGAVEFTQEYSLDGGDVFERALVAAALGPADDVEPDAAPALTP